MNAYLTYDRIEDRRWDEQQITDEKEKWIDDRAQKIIATAMIGVRKLRNLPAQAH
ncbi:host nuclease inhibitor GamL [Escherichia coli]|uniref:host nuclease inhibitor GamL n=1 Tax=Escherichia coli TaxID=562 RepID=UPI001C5BD4BD|nr:host nuclease inhibitor GamL [Escherichia coli]MBW4309885.1 host nuclease inhibitor GamL [Escherichia coli]